MKRVISARDIEELLKSGGDTAALPVDAIYTPSARDLLRNHPQPRAASSASASASASKPAEFDSPEMNRAKQEICDIGKRMWTREFVDGNSGNISLRVGPNAVLCTPTLVSKGFMTPDDICLVDLDGKQLAGKRPRTSEILMHLEIMKAQPRAKACVHGHPVHATAFAAARVSPPNNILTEYELFIGEVPVIEYITPGTKELGHACAKHVQHHNTLLLANHGVVAWGETLEMAYFRIEVIDAYCRTLAVAAQLRQPVHFLEPHHVNELLRTKQRIGIPDRRIGLGESALASPAAAWPATGGCGGNGACGCQCSGNTEKAAEERHSATKEPEAEELIQRITEMIASKLNG